MATTNTDGQDSPPSRHTGTIFQLWWPLAGSWFFMGLELPLVSAVMARLAAPEIHLAAYAGIVFPLSLLIEAPVIMLLAASTALSRNWSSYRLLRNFMWGLAWALTALHVLVAWTPLYDILASNLIGAPKDIIEPARLGLQLMTPWTGAIAIRRFQQGLLIRSGRTRPIGVGTAIRLGCNLTVLIIGLMMETLPGIAVATSGMSCGVIAEAIFIYWCVRPIITKMHKEANPAEKTPTFSEVFVFYIPLAMTPFFTLVALPVISAALSRMPLPLESLAVWPVLAGLSFTLRSVGLAYQEVIVALLDRPDYRKPLKQFAIFLGGITSGLFFLIAATPLSSIWFRTIAGLSHELATLGEYAIWFAVFFPGFSTMESYFQGILVHRRQTRGITEAVALSFLIISLTLFLGTYYGQITGLYIGLIAAISGTLIQLMWLWYRCRRTAPLPVGNLPTESKAPAPR